MHPGTHSNWLSRPSWPCLCAAITFDSERRLRNPHLAASPTTFTGHQTIEPMNDRLTSFLPFCRKRKRLTVDSSTDVISAVAGRCKCTENGQVRRLWNSSVERTNECRSCARSLCDSRFCCQKVISIQFIWFSSASHAIKTNGAGCAMRMCVRCVCVHKSCTCWGWAKINECAQWKLL